MIWELAVQGSLHEPFLRLLSCSLKGIPFGGELAIEDQEGIISTV